jgi:hypothetical protein
VSVVMVALFAVKQKERLCDENDEA